MATHQASVTALVLLLSTVTGCVGVSRIDGARNVEREVASASGTAPPFVVPRNDVASDARVAALLADPLTPAAAVEIALLRNPRVLDTYAQLGLSQADVVAATRLANPVVFGSVISGVGERQVIGGISESITDLLLLSTRKQLAVGEYERAQHLAAASMLDLIRDTEAAWYRYVGAEQIRTTREAGTLAAVVSADLAQKFYEAGNISDLELALNRSDASRARIASMHATAAARAAKFELQQRMGLSGSPTWRAVEVLPSPETITIDANALVARARDQRPDLVAARHEIGLFGDALRVAKRWRWLGTVEIGIEREREIDGHTLTGPTLALALPLFSQGQAGIARTEAHLEQSRARLCALESATDESVRLGLERVAAAEQIAREYRQSLVPQEELIVKRQQERQNFMLVGQFELLLARQQQYESYEAYLESIRDYWLARVDLNRAIGADLRSADLSSQPSDDASAAHEKLRQPFAASASAPGDQS